MSITLRHFLLLLEIEDLEEKKDRYFCMEYMGDYSIRHTDKTFNAEGLT